jgi:hypothetical protein
MPEQLKRKSETTDSKIDSSNVTILDNSNNSPRVLFFFSLSICVRLVWQLALLLIKVSDREECERVEKGFF